MTGGCTGQKKKKKKSTNLLALLEWRACALVLLAMESTYNELAHRITSLSNGRKTQSQPNQAPSTNQRILIALAGPPGSGKSTIAENIIQKLRDIPLSPSICVVGLDGFHLTRDQLHALPNASEAFARRGAPWTFDAAGAAHLVHQLRSSFRLYDVVVPTFDHQLKDPLAGGLVLAQDTEVCIVEGNYVLSDEGAWADLAGLMDERWLIDVDEALARRRIAARHVAAGIEPTLELALARADGNDLPNGRFVMEHSKGRYDRIIHSVDES